MQSPDLNLNNKLLGLAQARRLQIDDSNENKCAKEVKRINSTLRLKDDEKLVYVNYKSGVVYEGTVKDNLKSGHGTFVWPNGDKYTGEFKLNCRHGFGRKIENLFLKKKKILF
jgi:hypothetical protein